MAECQTLPRVKRSKGKSQRKDELTNLSFPPAQSGNERQKGAKSGEHALVDKHRGSKAPRQPLTSFRSRCYRNYRKNSTPETLGFLFMFWFLCWPEVSLENLRKLLKSLWRENPPKIPSISPCWALLKRMYLPVTGWRIYKLRLLVSLFPPNLYSLIGQLSTL